MVNCLPLSLGLLGSKEFLSRKILLLFVLSTLLCCLIRQFLCRGRVSRLPYFSTRSPFYCKPERNTTSRVYCRSCWLWFNRSLATHSLSTEYIYMHYTKMSQLYEAAYARTVDLPGMLLQTLASILNLRLYQYRCRVVLDAPATQSMRTVKVAAAAKGRLFLAYQCDRNVVERCDCFFFPVSALFYKSRPPIAVHLLPMFSLCVS